MVCQIIAQCSTHPGKPGIPAFWTEVSMYLFCRRNAANLLARIPNVILPSTSRRDIGWDILIPAKFSSFGMYTPSALLQESGMTSFLHSTFNISQRACLMLLHFLNTAYGTLLGPGEGAVLAFLRYFSTLESFGSDRLKGTDGSVVFIKPDMEPSSSSCSESE